MQHYVGRERGAARRPVTSHAPLTAAAGRVFCLETDDQLLVLDVWEDLVRGSCAACLPVLTVRPLQPPHSPSRAETA